MKIAVLGSGNGGCAVAADWSLHGHDVRIFEFEKFSKNVDAIAKEGGISVDGSINGFAKIGYAGCDIKKAIDGADFIFVVGPAFSIKYFAEAVKPYLQKSQKVCICPSSGGGAIVFKKALGLDLEDESYVISETSTLPYACRVYEPGKVKVYHKLTGGLYVAGLPGKFTEEVYDIFKEVYPGSEPAKSLIMTMIQTGNTIIHPAVSLLNAGRIEDTNGDFYFYENGATPAAGRLMEALDNEKLEISEALDAGIIRDTKVKLLQGYNAEESYETGYRTAPGFKGIKAQSQLDHRYINEDVGYGCVFISELGKQIGIETPVTDAVILIASKVMKRDYRAEGALTPKTLGIDGYSIDKIKEVFNK